MGAAVHPHSLTSRRPAAVPHACPSTAIRINPACVPKPAAAKIKKRPGFQQGEPPAKLARGVCGAVAPHAAAAAAKIKNQPGFQQGELPAKRARGVCVEFEPDAAAAATSKVKKRPDGTISDEDPVSSALRGMDALYAKKQVSSAPIHLPELVAPPTASPIRLPHLKAPPAASPIHLRQLTASPAASPIHLPELPAPPTAGSMRELLEKAHLAKAAPETICQSEIERRRAEARREIEQMVQTVEFNDPYIDPLDVLK